MHETELLITWVGLSIICLYPADDVRESISCPVELVISFFHHLDHQALKSPVIIQALAYEKQWHVTIACLITKFK